MCTFRVFTIMLIKFYIFILFNVISVECSDETIVDVYKTKIWGPGLQADKIVLPVYYFYIQPADEYGNPFNSSIPEKFTVEILGNTSTGKCLVQVDQLDRRDGVYIVRYKIFKMCWNVEINVMHKSKHAAKSPYRISGTIYSEKCRCPRPINEWLHNFKCNRSYDQIDSDLTPFNNINFTNIRPKMLAAFDSPGSISVCDYKIKDNNIFRKCYGQHTGFKMFVDSVLTTLVRIVELPDLEFIVNLGDYPLGKNSRTRDFPVFSWCGSDDAVDIVLPTYDITESSIEGMSRVSIDILSIQNARTSWSEKEPKAFWRGRDSRRERLHLIDIARKNPNLLNASLTNFFFFRNEESTYGPKSTHVSLFDFFNYKYQINVDGTVAAYRFPYLLSSNSLVFKQESRFYEHFYKQLSPMHHYIPIKRDLSNLVDQILWAKKNDQKAQKIAQNGQQFANEHLTSDKIFCYYVTLLKEWSKRLIDDIQIEADMKPLPADGDVECDCAAKKLTRDEF